MEVESGSLGVSVAGIIYIDMKGALGEERMGRFPLHIWTSSGFKRGFSKLTSFWSAGLSHVSLD